MKISLTHKFDAAHRLYTYSGECHNLHGHSWKVEVTVEGRANEETGILIDFKKIKELINKTFDHQTILNEKDNFLIDSLIKQGIIVRVLKCEPTAENIARILCDKISKIDKATNDEFFADITVKVWESDNAYAEAYDEI